MALRIPERRTNYCQLSPNKKRPFLAALIELVDVDLACERIQVPHQRWDETSNRDPNFRTARPDDAARVNGAVEGAA